MRNKLALQVVAELAEALRVSFNPHEALAEYPMLELGDTCSPTEILQQINELGKLSRITFFENRLTPEQLRELLEAGAAPALVFLNGPMLRPFVITGFRNGTVEGKLIDDDSAEPARFTVRDLADRAWAETPAAPQDATQILVVTPLLVNPLYTGDVTPTPMRRLWSLLNSERRDVWHIWVYALVVGALSLSTPLAVQAFMGLVSGGLMLEPIYVLAGFVVFATLVAGLLQILQLRLVETINQRIFAKASFEFAFRIPRMRIEALNSYYPPELINRFFDVMTVQKGFSKILTDMLPAILQILFGLTLLAFYHPFFVFFSLFLIAAIVILFRLTGPGALRTNTKASTNKYKVAEWLKELARVLPSVKLAGFTHLPMEKADGHISAYLYKREAHFRILMAQYGFFVMFKTMITGGLLIIGALLVMERQITLGQFVASEIVIITIMSAVEKLILSLETFYDVLTGLDKIGMITDVPLERTGGVVLPRQDKGVALEVRGLRYAYPDGRSTLHGIDLSVAPNERLGIAGEFGAGKSTLLSVLGGLIDTYQGAVSYDGYSLQDLNLNSLRGQIGDNITPNGIFAGALYENITMGKPELSLEDARQAIDAVGLTDFVQSLPDGMHTRLQAVGRGMPHLVVKRILLARALAEKPRLLVVDDMFSDVNARFYEDLQRALFDRARPCTVVLVSNSPLLLSQCDRVAILAEGRIIACGTFDEIARRPEYQRLAAYVSGRV